MSRASIWHGKDDIALLGVLGTVSHLWLQTGLREKILGTVHRI